MPEPAIADDRHGPLLSAAIEGAVRRRPETIAHGRAADLERGQGGEDMAADIGGDLVFAQFLLDQFHGGEDRALGAAGAEARRPDRNGLRQIRDGRGGRVRRAQRIRQQIGRGLFQEARDAVAHDRAGIFAGHRKDILTVQLDIGSGAVKETAKLVLDEFRLAFLDHKDVGLSGAEIVEFVRQQRIGDVQHIKWHLGVTIDIGQSKLLQRADDTVIHAALQDDADRRIGGTETLVQLAVADEGLGGGPAIVDLVLLMREGRRRQHHAREIRTRMGHGILDAEIGPLVVLAFEGPGDMAAADAHHQHDRRVRGLGQLEPVADRLNDRGQVRARVQQPELRLHRKGVAAFLHDRGTFAIILSDDDHGAAGDAAGCQIRQCIRGDIDPDRPLEGHGPANRVMNRGCQHGRRRRFIGIGLEAHAKLCHQLFGIGQHVHEVRDRRALIAADIADPRLQQCLGDGENAFTRERFAFAKPQMRDFCLE